MESYAVLPIHHIDKWEKLVNNKVVAEFNLTEFNDMYREVWMWNTNHLRDTKYRLSIKNTTGGKFRVIGTVEDNFP